MATIYIRNNMIQISVNVDGKQYRKSTGLKNTRANKKKVEEDCEGMTAGSVLAPSAQATGGNITNTDSYAPGDNRIPKSLFKTRVIKRKYKEEDAEEYPEIPADFFTDKELEKIEEEAESRGCSPYEVAYREYKARGGMDQDRKMTDIEVQKAFDELKSHLADYN